MSKSHVETRLLGSLRNVVPLALVLALPFPNLGCSHSAERQTRPARGPHPAAANGASEIARARCQREARCGNVGPSEAFTTHQQCVGELSASGAEDLSQTACPAGIYPLRLDNCLRSIASEECNSPLASLERSVDCRTSALCRN